MSKELKPCPFCGGSAELDTHQAYISFTDNQWKSQVAIYCIGSCDAHMGICYEDVPEATTEELVAELTEKWNSRRIQEGCDLADIQRGARIAELRILVGMLRCTPNEVGSRDHEYADWIEGRITAISASRPSEAL